MGVEKKVLGLISAFKKRHEEDERTKPEVGAAGTSNASTAISDHTADTKETKRRLSKASQASPITIKGREVHSNDFLPYPEPLSLSWASDTLFKPSLPPAPESWSDNRTTNAKQDYIWAIGPDGSRKVKEIGNVDQELEGTGEWTLGGPTAEVAGRGEWTLVEADEDGKKEEKKPVEGRWAKGNWPFVEDDKHND